jgi:pimeloyl-ACP methyl ester carboxylesterase
MRGFGAIQLQLDMNGRMAVAATTLAAACAAPALAADVGLRISDPVRAHAMAQARDTPAIGFTADGAAILFIVLTSSAAPSSATLTATNEATLAAYDTAYATIPPKGKATLHVDAAQIASLGSDEYVIAMLQAPDILKPGPDGALPAENQPVSVSISIPNLGDLSLQVQLYPPPVLFVHGLWGSSTSLQNVQTYLGGVAPYAGLPAGFLNSVQYENDAAFDSGIVQNVVASQLNTIITTLNTAEIGVGRVDLVAHSMGGLVARSFAGQDGYTGEPSRTLGLFHQVVTIDTPESGSLLANFLIDNAAATFSPKAPYLARKVKAAACPNATTVQACFAAQGENLTPTGQPISAGAVYSLEPGSPDIAGAPAANIPKATWHAIGATVSQSDSLLGANALVFELDELIAATCPGASYCPTASSKPPLLGTILGSNANDAIVTIASQTASARAPVKLAGLAHTTPADAGALSHWLLSYGNVLDSTPVNTQVGTWLANAAPQAPQSMQAKAPAAPWPGFDATRSWRQDDARIEGDAPPDLAMGTPFTLRIGFAAEQIAQVRVTERDEFHTPLQPFSVPVERAPDGSGIIRITPLLQGDVHIRVRADFRDYVSADRDFAVQVAPPQAAPAGFWADDTLHRLGGAMVMRLHLGGNPLWEKAVLQPAVVFATVPDRPVWLKGGVTYRVLEDAGAPAVSVDDAGHVIALRTGTSTIEVRLGNFTTTIQAVVSLR